MNALSKWILMLILFASQILHAETTINPLLDPPREHGGFRTNYRDFYGTTKATFEDFKRDLYDEFIRFGKGEESRIFMINDMPQKIVDINRYNHQDSTITARQIYDEMVIGPAPTGFMKSENSTYEMSRWSPDLQTIKWGGRDPEPGEVFLWFRGKCFMSLKCANLMSPTTIVGKVPQPDPGPAENPEEYVAVKKNPYAKFASNPGGDIYITVSGNNNNTLSPGGGGGVSTLNIRDDRDDRRQNYSGDGVQRIEYVQKTRAIDWVNTVGDLFYKGAIGLSSLKTAYNPATIKMQIFGMAPTYNIRNNILGNNGGGNGYDLNTPWSGGTNLNNIAGQFQPGMYDNGGGQLAPHIYPNNTGVLLNGNGYSGVNSTNNGAYGLYDNSRSVQSVGLVGRGGY